MHAAAPAKLHLCRQAVEIDLVPRVHGSEANRENACQPPCRCLCTHNERDC
jgi:hypothetical protein